MREKKKAKIFNILIDNGEKPMISIVQNIGIKSFQIKFISENRNDALCKGNFFFSEIEIIYCLLSENEKCKNQGIL